jgi:hypothetical protein
MALAVLACGTLVPAPDDTAATPDASDDADASEPIDEGDPDAAADVKPLPEAGHYVFVSSRAYAGVELQGYRGADDKCSALAKAAGLPGTYVAFLASNASVSALPNPVDWYLPDGTRVFQKIPDFAGQVHPEVPVGINEHGVASNGKLAWTGWDGHNCSGGSGGEPWTQSGFSGDVGSVKAQDGTWFMVNGGRPCVAELHRIYCFQK